MINVDVSVKIIYVKKYYIWNRSTCSCRNDNYLACIIEDSVMSCDKIMEETKTALTTFNEEEVTCKTQNFYILLAFLLIAIALLIAVSIYCYLIKY